MKQIEKSVLETAMDYTSYRQLIDDLQSENKTTGENHSEAMLNYTKMNVVRMKRLDKTIKLTEDSLKRLKEIQSPQIWLVLTEAWCGDAAYSVPVMEKFAQINANISLKIILRDEHLDIMDAFLTFGARSIPKLLVLNAETLEVVATWGPRPEEAQQMVLDSKEKMQEIADQEARKAYSNEVKTDVQRWYIKDKTVTIQKEMLKTVLGFQFV